MCRGKGNWNTLWVSEGLDHKLSDEVLHQEMSNKIKQMERGMDLKWEKNLTAIHIFLTSAGK